MEILDIHTHHPYPQPHGIINLRITPEKDIQDPGFMSDQLYSAGVHPWDIKRLPESGFWEKFERTVQAPEVVAIGECGVDLAEKTPAFIQLQVFRKQIEIAEYLHKPMILHAVKSWDIICGLRRDIRPQMPWLIHGYRGKPEGALQLVRSGCYIGFGEKFNPEALLQIPEDRILAETDESSLTIEKIIGVLSKIKGFDLTLLIKENSKNFLNFES